ncbi:MAG: hypothetical protein KC464_09380 [Myxococcales bacterium]|nr:hypothetical protein [Myxococcales bacterium]
MIRLKRNEIYDDVTFVFEVGPNADVITPFLDCVARRLGQDRFPLASVSRDEIQVGGNWLVGKRKSIGVVAQSKQFASQRTVFVCNQYGAYVVFGAYFATESAWFTANASDKIAEIKRHIADFDAVLTFEAFHAVMRLVLDQVIYLDLGFKPLRLGSNI